MDNLISLNTPGRVIFGAGAYNQVCTEIEQMNAERVLLLSDRPFRAHLETKLTSIGLEVLTFSSFKGEPDIEVVNECLKLAEGFDADICIGLGGGSVLDTAKLVAWVKGNGCTKINDLSNISFSKHGIPMIMIPTTSGTGSEATPNAIFLDKEKNKKAVVSRHMIPEIAIVDPELMITLPPKLTALTGIDALAHCVESFLSKNGSLWSDELAIKGTKLIYKSLHAAIDNGDNLVARQDMALGSLLGGAALTNAGTCSVHALAYPLAKYGISHSQGVAMLYPYVMLYLDSLKVEKVNTLKKAIEVSDIRGLINPIIDGFRKINVPYRLKDANIPEEDIDIVLEEAMMQERLLKNNPIDLSKDSIKSIYVKAFNGDLD